MNRFIYATWLFALLIAPSLLGSEEKNTPPRHELVLSLKPVGYWPADEGQGKILHDLSGNGNHGAIYSVPWKGKSLIFENDVYQWIQVPCIQAYRGPTFSMGGWVFSTLHERKRLPEHAEREFLLGALIVGQPFKEEPDGKLKWGAGWGKDLRQSGGAMLRFGLPDKSGLSPLDLVSGNKADVLGGLKSKVGLQSGRWQHVIYTYAESGEAKLYIDGALIQSAKDVPYTPTTTPYVFGGGRWGTFNLGGTTSMAGSLRDMVLFDRALGEEEVRHLASATKPSEKPKRLPPQNAEKEEQLPGDLNRLIAMVSDKSLDRDRRAQAVIKLSGMGTKASSAVAILARELGEMDRKNGAHLPRVEEYHRNALIQALLKINPDDPQAEAALAKALAKPYFETLDLSRTYLEGVAALLQSGKEMEALQKVQQHFAQLPKLPKPTGWGSQGRAEQLEELRSHFPLRQEYFDRYLSKQIPFADAHYSAYNQIDSFNDSTYLTILERVPYEEVLALHTKHLSAFSKQRPDADAKWTRVKIVKIKPDGSMQQELLVGDWFIFDARDEKMDGWAVALDEKGYLHLIGGQHNTPNQDNYLPGSWEKLGIAEGAHRPQIMYWVSAAPEEIQQFDFVGQKNSPRRITGLGNYMNYAKDPEGRLYACGRGHVWSWALVRYDAESRRWSEIRGSSAGMLSTAQKENPAWYQALGDTMPYHSLAVNSFVCAWQPGAYNFCRHARPLTFDRTGRMHVTMGTLGVGKDGRMTDGPLYAYSDDLGRSFHAASGKRLKLPLTVNPIPSHNASISSGPLKARYDLWTSLVKELP